MGKRNRTIAMQPHPMPDRHERLVRALRLVGKSAPCPTRMCRGTKRAVGLDDPADNRMEEPSRPQTSASERPPAAPAQAHAAVVHRALGGLGPADANARTLA
jgi:hypothetical protein